MFHVRLLDRLSSKTSHTGQSFEAVTVASVQAADGALLAPAGATVRGHVVAANAATSTLRIQFDSIETRRGLQPLRATLAPIQQAPALESTSFTGPGTGYDIAITPPPPGNTLEIGADESASPAGPETGPMARAAEPAEIVLEVDATIRLMLTAPLGMGW
jgi:hypothetical protein